MPLDESPRALEEVEVSVGWQSSPLGRAMFDRPSSSSMMLDETPGRERAVPTPLGQKRPASASESIGGSLGKYSELLPGSSPPMPRLKVRKNEGLPAATQPKFLEISTKIPTPEPDFSDDSDSDLEDLIAMQPAQFSPSFFHNRRVLRLVVQGGSSVGKQVILSCTDADNKSKTVTLAGSWTRVVPEKGDTIHIIGDQIPEPIEVNDSNGLFAVINPDILVPCTSVAESMSCERQIALRGKVRVPSEINEHTVLGTLKHELIQDCLMRATKDDPLKAFSSAEIDRSLSKLLDDLRLDLFLVGLDVPTAKKRVLEQVPLIQTWAGSMFGNTGQAVDTHRGQSKMKIRLRRTAQVEEEIRSPFWGLVGKPDVTVETTEITGGNTGHIRLAGLEIKTGKNTSLMSHRAQTSLYTLLLAERHPNNTHPWSLLYYTSSGITIAVTSLPSEVRELIQQRNIVARNIWHLPDNRLPSPTAASEKTCEWCSRKNSCGIYTATVDGGNTSGSPGLSSWFNDAVAAGKFAAKFLEFITHWNHLLDLEYDVLAKPAQLREKQWWLVNSKPLLLQATTALDSGTPNVYAYRMEHTADAVAPGTAQPFGVSVNDRIVVSTKQQMGLAFGLCIEAGPRSITIAVSNALLRSGKYRVDVERWSQDAHLGLARNNLVTLMDFDRLRELIVDMATPQFSNLSIKKIRTTADWVSGRVLSNSAAPTTGQLTNRSTMEEVEKDDSAEEHQKHHLNLNEDQTLALNKVLSAKDYALVLGMPGTGKTTTIAAIVASIVTKKQSVLISAYTNSAVDTIVRKLLSANIDCLRLGSGLENVHPDVQRVSASAAEVSGEYERFLEAPVVACTSHYINHKLFALRKFEYCIVDEASQITLPFCLGPIRLASKFVLVGDHYQLPPLVRNQEAKLGGLDNSLFKMLCEAHPMAIVELTKQYRMCEDIMSLSSELVYGGRLTCGDDTIARQKLDLPQLNDIVSVEPFLSAVDPENRVVFINTDTLGEEAFEKEHNGGISNAGEASIIQQLILQFAAGGLAMNNLAVISVYRKQLSYLRELLSGQLADGLEVLTADQAQGRDKKCIIVSLVRSNSTTRTGELLKDWRRLNVAFTRAKQKLVIVGSKRTMKEADGVARFFDFIEKRNWVHDARTIV